MSWRDQMRPGSFRGVPFYVRVTTDDQGRLAGVHQVFASGETPRGIPHDNGRALSSFTIEAFVVGDDYLEDLDRLEDALLQPGPGDLVHPFRGAISVVVLPGVSTTQDAIENGGMATVRFSVKEAGRTGLRKRSLPTEATRTAAASALAASSGDFAKGFSIADLPAAYHDSAIEAMAAVGAVLADLEVTIVGAAAPVTETAAAAAALGVQSSGLLSSPATLAASVAGAMSAVFGSARVAADAARELAGLDPVAAVTEFRRLAGAILHGARTVFALPELVPAVNPVTVNRTREAANLQQVRTFVLATTVAETARTLTWTPYSSRTEALAALTVILGLMETVDVEAGDALFAAQAVLRQQTSVYLKDVARGLPEVTTYRTADWTNAVLIAHELYGNARRADEIAARNDLAHSGMIPPGLALEVLVG